MKRQLVVALLLLCSIQLKALPTGVGSGGDVLNYYLQAMRQSFVQSLLSMRQHVDLDSLCECKSPSRSNDMHCKYLLSLSKEQRKYCRDFILQTLPQLWKLNVYSPTTSILATADKLLVKDPYGIEREVTAKTKLGASGEIWFNDVRTRALWPKATLAVMGHEFGHKVQFNGAYVDDNPPIGPFNYSGGGRSFLDSIGAAFATYAANHSFVGQYTGVEERFSCRIVEQKSGYESQSEGDSGRIYVDSSLTKYEASVGVLPKDFMCRHKPAGHKGWLSFRVKIHEAKNCEEDAMANERWTTIELWEEDKIKNGKRSQPTKLFSKKLEQWNPICKHESREMIAEYELGERTYQFNLEYLGTQREIQGKLAMGFEF